MESRGHNGATPRGLLNCSELLSRSHLEKARFTLLAYVVKNAIQAAKVYPRHRAAISQKEHPHVSSSKR